MKKSRIFLVSFLIVFALALSLTVPLCEIFSLENGFLAGYDDVQVANSTNRFGLFIKTQLEEKESQVAGEKVKQNEVVFKLFGFIPIRKVDVKLCTDEVYYVGGVPIGLDITARGAIVISSENSSLKEGDIITKINGQEIENLQQIEGFLEIQPEEAEIEYIRKNKPTKTILKTTRDEFGKLKLGLWVKDDIAGVGTLTFVNKDSKKYSALGHPIVESSSGNIVPVSSGDIYECNLIGINKGKRNNPGELKCIFMPGAQSKGTIDKNCKFGINGVLNDTSFVDENVTAHLGGRLGVVLGDAKIVSSISGIREEYDIEIIKTNYQKHADDKSIVFRVKDKRLLNLTGGIVQGMSGSPIMQNGKIIGAVTHVFLSDPTKGYGVYTDWML